MKGLKQKEPSYIALVIVNDITPSMVIETLKSFEDVMLDQLLNNLPPRRGNNHEIELILGVSHPKKHHTRWLP